MRLHVWTSFTTAGSSSFDCNWEGDLGINCVNLGHVALQRHFTCSATSALFLSFEVRACCDSVVDFTGKKVVSVVAIFKIEVTRDFYVTKQRISTSWVVCRLLGCSRRPPSAALRLLTVACIATRNQTFASYLSLKLSVLPFRANLPWKIPCLQSSHVQQLCST